MTDSTPKGTLLAPAAMAVTASSQAFSKGVRLPPLTAAAPSSAERSGNRPAPMKMLAKTKPMTQAMAVVTRK